MMSKGLLAIIYYRKTKKPKFDLIIRENSCPIRLFLGEKEQRGLHQMTQKNTKK
jgi:hypothetical protein